MKCAILSIVALLLLAGAALAGETAGPPPPLPGVVPAAPEAAPGLVPESLATAFLTAFCNNDRAAIGAMLPKSLPARYGPCLFSHLPALSNARVNGTTGMVDFEGPMLDADLPTKGMITFRRCPEGEGAIWRVRQIYWYRTRPPEAKARLEKRAIRPADVEAEPVLLRAATDFLTAWLAGDYQAVDRGVFRWWDVPRAKPRWVKLARLDVQRRSAAPDSVRIDFGARLRLAGLMPKQVKGSLWLVQEEGQWRVRPLSMALVYWGAQPPQ